MLLLLVATCNTTTTIIIIVQGVRGRIAIQAEEVELTQWLHFDLHYNERTNAIEDEAKWHSQLMVSRFNNFKVTGWLNSSLNLHQHLQ